MEGLVAQLEEAKNIIAELQVAPFDASKVPGILTPKRPLKPKPTRDKTRIDESEGGSITMRGLDEKKQAALAIKDAEAKAIQGRKAVTAAKKAAVCEERAALQVAFELCSESCRCGAEICPMAKKQCCPHCKEIKSGDCRKQACRTAAAPLMLTLNEPPAV